MAEVNVLQELLSWSSARPAWQRDALRRLVTNGALSDNDLIELTDICKGDHGLVEKVAAVPLRKEHIPEKGAHQEAVTLTSLTHHNGVNALARNQKIEFGPGLTIIYGDNAAGKSGYTRILKRACRARGAEEILGNVVSGTAPGVPSTTLKCAIGTEPISVDWQGGDSPNPSLGRISVFDRHCASVYIAEKTDVAFRPFGLDLFDKLSDACLRVRRALEKEIKEHAPPPSPLLDNVKPSTRVAKLIDSLSSLTEPEAVRQLASMSEEDTAELEDLKKRRADLAAASPQKLARELELRANRTDAFLKQALGSNKTLSDEFIRGLFAARDRVAAAEGIAEELRRRSFEDGCLPGSGSLSWRNMWLAARTYSESEAYPEEEFPVVTEGAACVLCQQTLEAEASERLINFRNFLASATESDREEASKEYELLKKSLRELKVETTEAILAVEELRNEDGDLAELASAYLRDAVGFQQAVLAAIESGVATVGTAGPPKLNGVDFSHRTEAMRDRAAKLKKGEDEEAKRLLDLRLDELESRVELSKQLSVVLGEITRLKRLAAFQLCLSETSTNGITLKSSELTEQSVTKQLANSFMTELKALKFQHIEIELKSAGGNRGALYHRLELKRAPGISVPQVVSEGEARCLSIASFFAELSTADDASAILFDDPVSSLDHIWRENVAGRLVNEAQTRQVVVFTHDIVFLLSLTDKAERLGVNLKHQHIRRDSTGSGVAISELPWPAMKVKTRIGYLKSRQQEAAKFHRDEEQSVYEALGQRIYGQLRETWERAVEEVLLFGVVERYRNSVNTLQARYLADIAAEDLQALENGMSKCSRWLAGHDSSAAENAPFPDPDDILADIEDLEDWTKEIRARRG